MNNNKNNFLQVLNHHFSLIPGLLLSAAVAIAGIELGKIQWLSSHGFSSLTLAIVIGIIVGNTIYSSLAKSCGTGVVFSKQMLLRAGIVLYGLRLTLRDIEHVGMAGVLIDILMICSTFGLAWWLGVRVFKIDEKTAMLIGSGSAICGAAAVMATEPVVKGRAEQVTVAVATVVVFGTLAIFLYPVLYSLNLHWHFIPGGDRFFGIYTGSTIHEVAQVVAAARSISVETADIAVITKMVRVMLLAPFLVILSGWLAYSAFQKQKQEQKHQSNEKKQKVKLTIPWFAFGFIAVVLFNSLSLLPKNFVSVVNDIDTLFLAMAMGALGIATHMSSLKQAGIKPLLLALLLFIWLIVGGAAINSFVLNWLN